MVSYSIIIPHKNIPNLLQRCLDSIPIRSDVQVIVIDDNSDEDKVDFSHFPQWGGDEYEYYLTKEGKGAGFARNVGLEHAKGTWLVFLDADDLFLPVVSEVFDEEINTEDDIVFFRPKPVLSNHLEMTSTRSGSKYSTYIDKYFETGDEVELRTLWHSPWSKLIKNSFVSSNGIRFDETKYSNDVMFSTKTGCEAKRIAARDKSFYVVTEREGSLTSDFCHKAGELETRASVFFRAQQVVRSFGYPIDDNLAIRYLCRLYDGNREEFKKYFNAFRKMTGYSRKELIDDIFEANSFVSRLKRKVCAFWITAF